MTDNLNPHSGFDELLGTEWLSDDPDDARARIPVRDELRQPYGIVHGGVLSSLVEGVCSRATALAVWPQGSLAVGQAIEVSLLRPLSSGAAEARAVARHRGRTTWVWEVEVFDAEERLCALAKMTVAVRPRPDA